MKNVLFLLAVTCSIVIFATGCGDNSYDVGVIDYPYTHEYVRGCRDIKGNVDVNKFKNVDPRFDIGANEKGYAVFKDPNAAYTALCEKYAGAIEAIQKEFDLEPLKSDNYEAYLTYGDQTTKCDKEMQNKTCFVLDSLKEWI